MKTIKIYLLALTTLIVAGCTEAFDNLSNAKEIENISVNINVAMSIDDLLNSKLTLQLTNYDENLVYTFPVDGNSVQATGIIPGIYTISVTGKGMSDVGFEYVLNGNLVNQAVLKNGENFNITVLGVKKSSLIFKELYFAGVPSYYFRDQCYELYNNSSSTIYLDGIYIANLHPTTATTSLPTWEDEPDKFVYGARVWKFPGNGTDYPLQPGESVVLAQHAINHKAVNEKSPVDLSIAEFEFYMGSTVYADQPAINMDHVFYQGKSGTGSIQMWLVSVFGGAYVIFSVPDDVTWDPVNDPQWSAVPVGTTSKTPYAKIPVEYVLDAVELGNNESMVNAKRIPGVLDAGMSWVGTIYCGLGVCRHFEMDEEGNPKTMEDGSYIYMDTNNSTDDFERGVVPEIRRNGAKMPSWSHSLQ